MYKCIRRNAPVRLTNELIMTADTHDCNTRASTRGVLQVPKPSSELFRNSFRYKGLHYGIVCHPISKMPRMLIVSSASIRSGSSNDHMSGTLNVLFSLFIAIWSTGNKKCIHQHQRRWIIWDSSNNIIVKFHIQVWTETSISLPAYTR